MYPPPYHQENEFERIKAVMAHFPLATLLSCGNGEIFATHAPLMWSASEGEFGKLVGHIDRNNPQTAFLDGQLTAIFHGPDSYISPNVYASEGKLPTWNYVKVHIKGKGTVCESADWVRDSLLDMTERMEKQREATKHYQLDPKNAYMNQLIQYVVGFELEIEQVEGKFKLSQDKPAQDLENAFQELKNAPIGRGNKFMDWLAEE